MEPDNSTVWTVGDKKHHVVRSYQIGNVTVHVATWSDRVSIVLTTLGVGYQTRTWHGARAAKIAAMVAMGCDDIDLLNVWNAGGHAKKGRHVSMATLA